MYSKLFIALFFLILSFTSCKEKGEEKAKKPEIALVSEPTVIDIDNPASVKNMQRKDFDSLYLNLLDPENVSEEEYEEVVKSWSKLHNKISKYMKSENFHWNVSDSAIKVSNRIYFDEDGTIDYYFFRVINPDVTSEKKTEYVKLLKKFSEHEKIGFKRDFKYGQCGNIQYQNK